MMKPKFKIGDWVTTEYPYKNFSKSGQIIRGDIEKYRVKFKHLNNTSFQEFHYWSDELKYDIQKNRQEKIKNLLNE